MHLWGHPCRHASQPQQRRFPSISIIVSNSLVQCKVNHSLSNDRIGGANSYFEVLGEKASHKKLTEVNSDAVEEEVTISSSIVDGDKALEVLVECFC